MYRRNGWPSRPDRLHILWCVPEVQSLSWASTIIDQLIEDAWASPRPDKLEIRLHITQQTESSSIILDSQSNVSIINNSLLLQYFHVFKKIYVNFVDKGSSVPAAESNPKDRVRSTQLGAAVFPMEGGLSKV